MKKFLLLFTSIALFFPRYALAHAFGQIYTLPLPAWLYFFAGGATVVVSFLLIGFFLQDAKPLTSYPTKNLDPTVLGKIIKSNYITLLGRLIALCLFVLGIVAGFFGQQLDPTANLLTILFWLYLLLGVLYAVALVGDFWITINPFNTLLIVSERFLPKKPLFNYPKQIEYIPALGFLFSIVWLELLSGGFATVPRHLAFLLLSYGVSMIIVTVLWGKTVWLTYVDVFSVLFRTISSLSLLHIQQKKLLLRPPFIGALKEKVTHGSLLVFIITLLGVTAFDGFRATAIWAGIDQVLQMRFAPVYPLLQTLSLFITIAVFVGLYFTAISFMKLVVKTKLSVMQLGLMFAYSLVPIVLAYNVAHYYTLLLVQGQALIAILSDPLNLGWNLFGTKNYSINVGIVSAGFVWNSQVIVIVLGHIIAVYLAHLIALQQFRTRKQALMSQIPMLLLMVLYTITGLWILSQPLSIGR